MWHVFRWKESIPAVYHWLFNSAPRWTGQPASQAHSCTQGINSSWWRIQFSYLRVERNIYLKSWSVIFTFLSVGWCYWCKLSISEYMCALSKVAGIFFGGNHERTPASCYNGEGLSSQLSFEVQWETSETFKILVKPLVLVCREVCDPPR